MARRKATSALARTTYVTAPRQPAPIVRVSMPRAAKPAKRRKGGHRKGNSGGPFNLGTTLGGAAVAAGMVGLAESTGLIDKLPAIPIVGRKGALAVLAYLWAKHGGGGQMARDVAIAAATLAAYQLGKDKKIDGDVDGNGDGY